MHRVEPAEPAGAAALLDHRYAQRLLPLSDAAALNLSACWLNRTQQKRWRQTLQAKSFGGTVMTVPSMKACSLRFNWEGFKLA